MKIPTEVLIRRHGIEHEQYFQGDSAVFTKFDACYIGCGYTEEEAIEDALDNIAQAGEYNADDAEALVNKESIRYETDKPPRDCWYYVSLLVKEK